MSDWKVIVPSGTTNYQHNPSFEEDVTTGWDYTQGAGAGGSVARSTARSKFGVASALLTASNGNDSQIYTEAADAYTLADGASVVGSAYIYKPAACTGSIRIYNITARATAATTTLSTTTGDWIRSEVTWTNSTGAPADVRLVINNGAADSASIFYIDGAQLELGTEASTYCDGDQPGCEWNGDENDSTSSRSAVSRAGGLVEDLEDDYYLHIESVLGAGMTARITSRDGFGQLPGGALNASVRASRTMTLVGLIKATSLTDFHDKRKALIDLFSPEAYPKTEEGWQPVTLRYTGGTTDKEIKVHYEAGLEGDNSWQMPFNERVAIRLYAPDPNWYAIGETSTALDTNDTATLRYVGGRLKSTGQWDDLGLTANPTNAGGESGYILSVLIARDGTVYYGGDFDGLNGDAPAGMDFVAKYTPSTATWAVLVGAADVNDYVRKIVEGPDGTIYLCGDFTAVNGVGTADYIVAYDPSTDTWSSLGDPDSGAAAITSVNSMAFDNDGNLYVGGNFTNFANVADCDYFCKWDGAAWGAVGSGGTGTVSAIAIDEDNNIFIGGSFTNWNADGDADYWAWYEQSAAAWTAVDDIALNSYVLALTFDDTGNLYVGGNFTDAASVSAADKIFRWTGTAIEPLGAGLDDVCQTIRIAPDGIIWVGGVFDATGDQGLDFVDGLAIWTGSSWASPDAQLAANPQVRAIATGKADPVISENYDVYIGFYSTGSAYFSGTATVTNGGSIPAYPRIIISRSGGTTARLISIRNETTGKILYCSYDLVDGETLTIDTAPDEQTVTSSVFGSSLNAVLPGSDWSEFQLIPGANQITCFVDVAGAPTITANLLVKTPFDGVDD